MDAEIKAKWVEALRSGKYAQARETVCEHETGALCCLAVGYVVSTGRPFPMGGITQDCSLELGLDGDVQEQLVMLNDDEGATFSEIADYIERHL